MSYAGHTPNRENTKSRVIASESYKFAMPFKQKRSHAFDFLNQVNKISY